MSKKDTLKKTAGKKPNKKGEEPKTKKPDDALIKTSISPSEVSAVLKAYENERMKTPTKEEDIFSAAKSRQFKDFIKEEWALRAIKTFYEKSCIFLSKFVSMKIDKKKEIALRRDLEYLWMNIEPNQTMSLALVGMFFFFIISAFLVMTGAVCGPIGMIFALIGIFVFFYVPSYPHKMAEEKRKRSMGEMPMVVLYLVMYLRNTPVLEGGIQFAAEHLKGPIALDLRKMMWDVETRLQLSVEEGIGHYAEMWSVHDPDFAQVLRLLAGSINEPNSKRRMQILDMAVSRIMESTSENMVHYTQALKTPVTMLHALGVILPVMGLVMFPMVIMFLGDMVDSKSLFIFYDILLAGIVFFKGSDIVRGRPETVTSMTTVKSHPSIPRPG
ncbi:hypothetical protein ACFLQI_03600, partial [Candidatus Undinarchaeota archaeon]